MNFKSYLFLGSILTISFLGKSYANPEELELFADAAKYSPEARDEINKCIKKVAFEKDKFAKVTQGEISSSFTAEMAKEKIRSLGNKYLMGCILKKAKITEEQALALQDDLWKTTDKDIKNLLTLLNKEDSSNPDHHQKTFNSWLQHMEEVWAKNKQNNEKNPTEMKPTSLQHPRYDQLNHFIAASWTLGSYQNAIQKMTNFAGCLYSNFPTPKSCKKKCESTGSLDKGYDYICLNEKERKDFFANEANIYHHCEYLLPKPEQLAKSELIQKIIALDYNATTPTEHAILQAASRSFKAGVSGWTDLVRISILSERKNEFLHVLGSAALPYFRNYPEACLSSETMKLIWEAPPSSEEKIKLDETYNKLFSTAVLEKLHINAKKLRQAILLRAKEQEAMQKRGNLVVSKTIGRFRYSKTARILDAVIIAGLKAHPFFLGSYQIDDSFWKDLKEVAFRNKPILVDSVLLKEPPLLKEFAEAKTTEEQKKVLEESFRQVGAQFYNEISELCKPGKIFQKQAKYQLPQLIAYENSLFEHDQERAESEKKSILSFFPEYLEVHECISEVAMSRGEHHGARSSIISNMSANCHMPVFCSVPQILAAVSEYFDYHKMGKLCNEVGTMCTKEDQEKVEELRSAWKTDAVLGLLLGIGDLSSISSVAYVAKTAQKSHTLADAIHHIRKTSKVVKR